MISRCPIALLLASLLAMGALSCAPNVRDLNLSQEIVDHLPKDQALSFLQSLGPSAQLINVYCRFEEDGVVRWQRQGRGVLPGKYPYTFFYAKPRVPGTMIVVALYVPQPRKPLWSHEPWCIIAAEANADRQGKEAKSFTAKILTALLSMGVRVPAHGGDPVRVRSPTSR